MKKGNTALLDAVNATLDRIKSDGTYDTLYAKYIGAQGLTDDEPDRGDCHQDAPG